MARSSLLLVSLSLCLATACSGKDPYAPGDAVGVFHVSGKLVAATCGETPNPWEFDVRLRHEHTTLYWVQGGAPIQGQIDTNAKAVLTSSSQHTVRDADPKTKTPACIVGRTDTLEVTLTTAGTKSTNVAATDGFTGTLVYRFAPDSGDCAEEVGKTFKALPCEVSYEVSGAKTDAKLK